MPKDCVLALDLGTTGNRAVVFDARLRVLAQSYREFPQIFPQPGFVEHDPEQIWSSARECLQDALKAAGSERIAALGVTNQRETSILWDRRSSKPLCNAIVWQDRRTAEACESHKSRGAGPLVHERTGLFLDPYFSATKIRWMLEHVPGAAAAAATGEAAFGTVDSWLIWKLTGGKRHATDASNASRTLLYSLSGSWDPELCRTFGVPEAILPSVQETTGHFGDLSPELFGASLPILAVAGDQQASLFAQGGFTPEVAKNTYGTGLFLMTNAGAAPVLSERLLTTIAWRISGATEYALEGSVFVGGAAVQWLRDGLGFFKSSPEIEALAGGVADSGGVTFVPALTGLGAPYWDPGARGAFFGLTRGSTRAHLARATLEAMALQTVDVVREMERTTGRALKRLQVDGGACSNDLLMQIQADLLGIPVERYVVRETTALGAAALAGIEAGVWPDRGAFLAHRAVDRVFEPRLPSSARESAYGRWKDAVGRTLSVRA